MRAKGIGAHVIVTEVDPMPALEAAMDGFEVLSMEEAAAIGDIFCTATGDKSVIARPHMEQMKDGAILCNTGHFNVEIEIGALRALATETRQAREFVEEFTLADGRRLYLIADGRLVNLAAAEGHPAIVMDMSFANQALSAEYVVQNAASLEKKVYVVPKEIDDEIARLKLATMGVDDRHAHGGAGEVPGLVGRGNLNARAGIVRLEAGAVVLLDQRRLPDEEVELRCESAAEVAEAIRTLAVRGAPAIGIAAAYGYALAAERGEDLERGLRACSRESRPTAVNLVWALEQMRDDPTRRAGAGAPRGRRSSAAGGWPRTRPRSSARERARSRTATRAGSRPAATAPRSARCATAWEDGLLAHVWVDETRPLLQGARLTAWELEALGHPARGDRRRARLRT